MADNLRLWGRLTDDLCRCAMPADDLLLSGWQICAYVGGWQMIFVYVRADNLRL